MATLLARKAGSENPIATDDDHHEALASDPAVSAFPQGSSFGGGFGNATSTNGAAAFGAPQAGGFGAAGGFSTTTTTSSTTSSFGTSPSIQGAGSMAQQPNQADLLKSGGGAMSEGGESTVALDKDATDWINKKWRPVMGWVYMMTCTADFVIFPVAWSLLQALTHGNVTSQWQPLTLQGAGLYHIAMGAVLGIAAYGRTKEKIEGAAK